MTDLMPLALISFIIGWLPIHLDPFYHQERVSFYEWLRREIYELQYGEQAKLLLGIE